MTQPSKQVTRSLDGMQLRLPLSPRWELRALVAGLIALGLGALSVGGVAAGAMSILTLERPTLPVCSWSEPYAWEQDCDRHLSPEAFAYSRRAFHLQQLDPRLIAEDYYDDHSHHPADAFHNHLRSLPEAERQLFEQMMDDRRNHSLPWVYTPFDVSQVAEPGYLSGRVRDPIPGVTAGGNNAIRPIDELSREADRRTAADLAKLTPIMDELGQSAALDGYWVSVRNTMDMNHRLLTLGSGHPAWTVARNGGFGAGLGFLLVGLGLLYVRLRRPTQDLQLDATSITIAGKKIHWTEVEDTDLTWRRPSVLLKSGTRIQLHAVQADPRVAMEAQQLAQHHLGKRSAPGTDEAEEEARRALGAMRERAERV